jgi:hypothetical protein
VPKSLTLATRAAVAILLFSGHAAIASEPAREREVTVYVARGVDSDLLEMVPKLFQGDLQFDDTRFIGIGYVGLLRTPDALQRVFDFLGISRASGSRLYWRRAHFPNRAFLAEVVRVSLTNSQGVAVGAGLARRNALFRVFGVSFTSSIHTALIEWSCVVDFADGFSVDSICGEALSVLPKTIRSGAKEAC